jgi:hypothetical protein
MRTSRSSARFALGTSTARMRYEALVRQPQRELGEMLDRLDPGDHDLAFLDSGEVEVAATEHSVRGNPMRFSHGRQKLRVDDAWRSQMTRGARRVVTLVTWPLLLGYGYLGDEVR